MSIHNTTYTKRGGKTLLVNGEILEFDSELNINKLLLELKLFPERVVVEVNMNIISKEHYETTLLDNRDTIEIVGFVGGG